MFNKKEFEDKLNDRYELSHNNLPCVEWDDNNGTLYLEFMVHDNGCWVILSRRHSSEEHGRINIGTYVSLEDINTTINALQKGY